MNPDTKSHAGRPASAAAAPSGSDVGASAPPLRILFVLRDALPAFRSDITALFGKYLPRYGIQSDIIGQRAARRSGSLTWLAGEVTAAGLFRNGLLGQLAVPFKDALAMLRHRRPFDLVQVRDKIRSAVFGWALARFSGKPFVYWMSFPYVESFAITAANRERAGAMLRVADALRIRCSHLLYYRFVLKRADHVFVQSEAMREWLVAKGFERKRMTAVPMGVDVDVFQRDAVVPSDDTRLDGRRPVIYLGQVAKARDSAFLLNLITMLRASEPKALLVLAGDAPSAEEASWIRAEIARRRLEQHVLLTGWLSQQESLRYLVRAEVGLSPIPRGELFDVSSPTKLVEYLALGVPAVANDIPDQEHVIRRSKAGLCVPMELQAFHDAVLQLLRDADLCASCAERGPVYVRSERSYEVLAAHVARNYEAILARSLLRAEVPNSPYSEQ
jgi:glycosyltransferase involved in cell wall biosynthesis